MQQLGFKDAHVTSGGPDGGVDVSSGEAIAQVKLWFRPVGKPELQQLYGARGTAHHLKMLFYSHDGYAKPAIEFAKEHSIALFTFDSDGEVAAVNDTARGLVARQARRPSQPPARRAPVSSGPPAQRITSGRSVASILAEEAEAATAPVKSKPQRRRLLLPASGSASAEAPTVTTANVIPIQIRAKYGRTVTHMRFLQIGGDLNYRSRDSDVAISSPTAVVWLTTSHRLGIPDIQYFRDFPGHGDKWKVCYTDQPVPPSTLNEAMKVGIAVFSLFDDGSIDPENEHARALVEAAQRSRPLPPVPVLPESGEKSGPADASGDEEGSVASTPMMRGLYQNKYFQRRSQS